jgi:putative transposase
MPRSTHPYIRLHSGFIYLIAIIDWFSRYVLSWEISTTLDKDFCIKALKQALLFSRPEIFNTDQGVQFTSAEFVTTLQAAGIRVSMDGRGRAFDNIFVERLWRTVKYEEVYLHSYQTVCEARLNLEKYFHFYNTERLHQALEYRPPCEIYDLREMVGGRNGNHFQEGLGGTPIWTSLRSSIVGQL